MADIELRLGSDVLVVQGALGTMFAAEGLGDAGEMCYPFLNLTEPESVEDLHRRYLMAGASCAVTNTFLATSSRLAPHGLLAYVDQINVAGVRLASGLGYQHVLAAIGPSGVDVEPGSGLAALKARQPADPDAVALAAADAAPGYAAAVEQYGEQASALASAAPDALLLQTFTELDDALAAVDACRRVCDLPVFACMSFVGQPGQPDPADAARALVQAGASAVGCNCMDAAQTLAAIRAMHAVVDVPLIALPSGGTPDAFADAARALVQAGVRIVGSCCGSTPACTGAIFAVVG